MLHPIQRSPVALNLKGAKVFHEDTRQSHFMTAIITAINDNSCNGNIIAIKAPLLLELSLPRDSLTALLAFPFCCLSHSHKSTHTHTRTPTHTDSSFPLSYILHQTY